MNNEFSGVPYLIFNIKEALWDLLSQWKMILIVALLTSILVSGLKYAKDSSDYRQEQSRKEAVASEMISDEEKTANVMEPLTEEQRTAVLFAVNQNSHILKLQQYLDESLWLNGTPYDQRALVLSYYIKGTEEISLQELCDAYSSYLNSEKFYKSLGAVIDPDKEIKYIKELISVKNGDIADSNLTGILYRISIVLPEETDAAAVEKVFTAAINEANGKLKESIGDHTITLATNEETHQYDAIAMERRSSYNNMLNSLNINLKNYIAAFNENQKTAYDTIMEIRRNEIFKLNAEGATEGSTAEGSPETEAADSPKAAHFSLFYAIVGLFLGVFFYLIGYLIVVFVRDRLTYEGNAATYTGSRLLGDIYSEVRYTGISALMHSRLVDGIRYRGKESTERQLQKTVAKLKALCEHGGFEALSLVKMTADDKNLDHVIDELVRAAKAAGINANLIGTGGEIDEKDLVNVKSAVSLVGKDSRRKDLSNMVRLYNAYDITQLGCVYLGGR